MYAEKSKAEKAEMKEDTKMKMFQISDKLGEVSRIGIGCMRITGLPDEKAVRALIEGSMEAWH